MTDKLTQRLKFSATLLTTAMLAAGCTSTSVSSIQPVYRVQGQQLLSGANVYYAQGKQHFIRQNYGLALQAFRDELVRNPNSVLALNGVAACYDKMQRYDQAANYYYQALSLEPGSVATLGNLGYSFVLQGKNAEAKKVLSLALKKDPANVAARRHLALISEHPDDLSKTLVTRAVTPKVESPQRAAVQPAANSLTATKAKTEPAKIINTRNDSSVKNAEMAMLSHTRDESPVETVAHRDTESEAVVSVESASTHVEVENVAAAPVEKMTPVVPELQSIDAPSIEVATHHDVPDDATTSIEPASTHAEVENVTAAPVEEMTPVVPESQIIDAPSIAVATQHDVTDDVIASIEPGSTHAEVNNVAVAPVDETIPAVLESQPIEQLTVEVMTKNEVDAVASAEPDNAQDELMPVGITLTEVYDADKKVLRADATMVSTWIDKDSSEKVSEDALAVRLADVGTPVSKAVFSSGMPSARASYAVSRVHESGNSRSVSLQSVQSNMKSTILTGQAQVSDQQPIASARIELSNGNGREGIAQTLRNMLSNLGQAITSITNARHYNHKETVIYYVNGKRDEALKFLASLPIQPKLKEINRTRSNVDITLLIGEDFPEYSDVSLARVEVSNGNGRVGMARLMRNVLKTYGESVVRTTNADHFDHGKTIIYYSNGNLRAAEQLAYRLPVKPVLRETRDNRSGIDVKIVLGKDFLKHEIAMRDKLESNA